MAKFRRLTKSLCLLFIICALRQSLTNTFQGKEVQPSGTAKTEVSLQRASSRETVLKGKGLGGRKMMKETMDEMEVYTTSGATHSYKFEEKGELRVNFREGEKVSGSADFTADYDGPKHHTPKHN